MKTIFNTYSATEPIPCKAFIKNRKLVKYFNRETAAAVVAAGKLLEPMTLPANTPFYYETGVMEFESLGLNDIARESLDPDGRFSQQRFVEKGAKAVPPLTQFKALYNMPLSFVAIEHRLTGDNAVVYASAHGLLELALNAPTDQEILLGSGKVSRDGCVNCGFALVSKAEIEASPLLEFDGEAIELFRLWQQEAVIE